jgi:hypothetical protein
MVYRVPMGRCASMTSVARICKDHWALARLSTPALASLANLAMLRSNISHLDANR